MLVDDQWVLGGGGEQGGIDQELPKLGPELLDRYGKEFAAAWNAILDQLRFKAMLKDKPNYIALSAASSPGSPIDRLFTAIADETALTRDPGPGSEADAGTARNQPQDAADFARGLARIGLQIGSGKSQSRAGTGAAGTQGQHPGANIEAQFRSFQALVSGPLGRRPIDALTQNFRDIHQSLKLAADVPSQTERINANLQLQIATLRANVSRLPKQLARMVNATADEFEGNVTETSVANLNQALDQTVTQPCEEAVNGRYPFASNGTEDIAMADFAKLFAPGGVMDRFFAQNLASLIDMTGQDGTGNRMRASDATSEVDLEGLPAGGGNPRRLFSAGRIGALDQPHLHAVFTAWRRRSSGARRRRTERPEQPGGQHAEHGVLAERHGVLVRKLEPHAGNAGPRIRHHIRRSVGAEAAAGQGGHHRQRRQHGSALRHRWTRCRLYDAGRLGPKPVPSSRTFCVQLSEGVLR
ncbi:hypothetical protein AJ88_27055 [Mesorhizobium amorphae CCBAU 01583]|nr:hypothetical protein AJ88_27055 [Mesorhizobium amorphae CCBAU 01583]